MVIMNTSQTEEHMADSGKPGSGLDCEEKRECCTGTHDTEEPRPDQQENLNTEPNRPTEDTEEDEDSACGTEEHSGCSFENTDEAITGDACQETNPPSTDYIAQLTYRRDALERELSRCNEALNQTQPQPPQAHRKVKITYSLDGVEREALETFQREVGHFRNAMSPYGVVVQTYPGCVVIKLKIHTIDQLRKLKDDERNGKLNGVISEWLENNRSSNPEPGAKHEGNLGKFHIDIARARLEELEHFISKDVLTTPVHFTHCPNKKIWYWSADLKFWHHIYTGEVMGGEQTGKRLPDEDIDIIDKLQSSAAPFENGSKPCVLCQLKVRHPTPQYTPKERLREITVTLRWKKDTTNLGPPSYKETDLKGTRNDGGSNQEKEMGMMSPSDPEQTSSALQQDAVNQHTNDLGIYDIT